MLCIFFFQAEDGIRDTSVTGVQTCALPISSRRAAGSADRRAARAPRRASEDGVEEGRERLDSGGEIGRASCRERVQILAVAVALKKKTHESQTGEGP